MDLTTNNPYFNELKDKRLNLLNEQNIEGIMLLEYELASDYSIACPKCGSNIITKYGTYTRKIIQKIFQHTESIIILKLHKYKCCQCSTIFSFLKETVVIPGINILFLYKYFKVLFY